MKKTTVAGFFIAIIFWCASAIALPTPKANRLAWDADLDPDIAGFNLYWAKEAPGRTYVDTRKVDLGKPAVTPGVAPAPDFRFIVVIDKKPDAQSRLCFQLTAYDAAGNESGFSNEACDFFGLPVPTNLRAQ